MGVWMILVPSARNTSSKAPENLASRSLMRNRGASPSGSSSRRFRACWATQAESGFGVDLAHSTL
jgi:hypothetical protein